MLDINFTFKMVSEGFIFPLPVASELSHNDVLTCRAKASAPYSMYGTRIKDIWYYEGGGDGCVIICSASPVKH